MFRIEGDREKGTKKKEKRKKKVITRLSNDFPHYFSTLLFFIIKFYPIFYRVPLPRKEMLRIGKKFN